MGMISKKVILSSTFIIGSILLLNGINLAQHVSAVNHGGILKQLTGTVYYTKRLQNNLALYQMQFPEAKEKLIYSHKGKGMGSEGEFNDNICDFVVNNQQTKVELDAMYQGEWSILTCYLNKRTSPCFKEKPKECKVLTDGRIVNLETNYLSDSVGDCQFYEEKGSLYINRSGRVTCLRKFWGPYAEIFTGYRVIGLSPDGKYAIYRYLGTFYIDQQNKDKTYIMDLETMKSTYFIEFDGSMQWIQ